MPDSDHDPLPPSAALARRLADQRMILRLVGHDEPVDELPPTPEGLMEPPSGTGKKIRNGVLLALLSAGFVWLVTVNAWDHDGFFPWFWNVIWTLFPWVFLTPMWAGTSGRCAAAETTRRSTRSTTATARPRCARRAR